MLLVIVIAVIQLLVDGYVLARLRSSVRRRGWSPWWYRVPIILAVLIFPLFGITTWLRQTQSNPSMLNRALHYIVAAWYLPKVMIALSLACYDVYSGLLRAVPLVMKSLTAQATKTFKASSLLAQRLLHSAQKRFKPTNYQVSFISRHTHRLSQYVSAFTGLLSFKTSRPSASKHPKKPLSGLSLERRDFLRRSASALTALGGYTVSAAPFAIITYDAYRLMDEFQIHRVDIPLSTLPRQFDGLTITQISDLHAGSLLSAKPIQEMRRIIELLHSDMIMITGDWVNFRARELPIILPDIQQLCLPRVAPLGVFGCLGNHDHYAHALDLGDIISSLRSAGVRLLVNENHTITADGGTLQIAGNDNVGLRQHYGNLSKTLTGLTPEHPTLLMAHDPTLWDKQVRGRSPNGITIDLMLSGHTHGGQFGVHCFGMELSPAMLLYKQYAGLYSDTQPQTGSATDSASQDTTATVARQYLYVNRGIGTTGVPVRVGVPPEITVLTLRKA